MSGSHLDLSLLENVRHRGDDVISACPACREAGKDRNRDNLRIFASNAYHCIAYPKEREHNGRIFALVGVRGEVTADPVAKRDFRERRARDLQKKRDDEAIRELARRHRKEIVTRWAWKEADLWEDSPQRLDSDKVEFDPHHFLASLFPGNSIVWTGEVHESGQDGIHASRWKTVADWQGEDRVGPMTAPAIWKPDTTSRAAGNVASAPYVTLDFDGYDGRRPEGPAAIRAHLDASLAMIRCIREAFFWELAAILFTGSVSLHAWFHSPPPDVLESMRSTASPFGIDAGLIRHPEHPCRLPGQRHLKTGKLSRLLWLQNHHQTTATP